MWLEHAINQNVGCIDVDLLELRGTYHIPSTMIIFVVFIRYRSFIISLKFFQSKIGVTTMDRLHQKAFRLQKRVVNL